MLLIELMQQHFEIILEQLVLCNINEQIRMNMEFYKVLLASMNTKFNGCAKQPSLPMFFLQNVLGKDLEHFLLPKFCFI